MKRILVLCTGNSCRSQLAEGYLRLYAGNKAEVYSAGVETHGVNPRAILVMQEDGIDISGHTSNNIDEYRDIQFDFVITVCDNARERCPFFPGSAIKFHHNFPRSCQSLRHRGGNHGSIQVCSKQYQRLLQTVCKGKYSVVNDEWF